MKYSYKDIILEPKYSETLSRSDNDCTVELCGYKFNTCAVPANMYCTIDFDIAEKFDKLGYFYILHRFYSYDMIERFVATNQGADGLRVISISVGVKDVDKNLIETLSHEDMRVDFITIDIAHGDHILMKNMIKYIKDHRKGKFNPKIIAGNIGTASAASRLEEWGADVIKVGLSMGKSCTTYNCTGVGTPMFTTVYDISEETNLPIIADGGVREVGDVCKALVAGATMVMIGSEFAKCCDSPAKQVNRMEDIGVFSYHKEFFGSASLNNKGKYKNVEGKSVLLPMASYTMAQYVSTINDGVQSCISYCGGNRITDLLSMEWDVYTNT